MVVCAVALLPPFGMTVAYTVLSTCQDIHSIGLKSLRIPMKTIVVSAKNLSQSI